MKCMRILPDMWANTWCLFFQLHLKHGVGQRFHYRSLNLNGIFLGHYSLPSTALKITGPSSMMAMVCSKWADKVPVPCHRGPTIIQNIHLVPPDIDHGLYGYGQAGLQTRTSTGGAEVRHLRFLVQFFSYAMPHKIADDGESGRLKRISVQLLKCLRRGFPAGPGRFRRRGIVRLHP